MRGGSKVVGGSQFRVMTTPNVNGVVEITCTKCQALRSDFAKARQELAKSVETRRQQQQYIEVLETQHATWRTERDALRREIEQLHRDLVDGKQVQTVAESDCVQFERRLVELQAEFNVFASRHPTVTKCDALTQVSFDSDAALECSPCAATTSEERDRLECQLKAVMMQLEAATEAVKTAENNIGIGERRYRAAMNDHQALIAQKEQHVAALEQRVAELEQRVSSLERAAEEARQQMNRSDIAFRDQINTIEIELTATKAELATILDQLQAAHQQENAISAKFEERILSLESEACEQSIVISKLSDDIQMTATAKSLLEDSIADREQRICQLEVEITELRAQSSQLAAESARLEEQLQVRRDHDDKAAAAARQAVLELHSTATKLKELEEQIADLQLDVHERERMISRLQESHSRALERSLRLCVVAPTVNVHLRGGSTKRALGLATSASSDAESSVECKAVAPRQRIKEVVESEILPFFSSIFAQRDDDESPEPGVDLDAWLPRLLDDMKQQITSRLECVYG